MVTFEEETYFIHSCNFFVLFKNVYIFEPQKRLVITHKHNLNLTL